MSGKKKIYNNRTLKVRLFLWSFGYWLLTQGSNLYLLNNELPCGTAKTLGMEGLQAMQIGEWKNHPLRLVAEQESDEREYVSLRGLLSLPEDEFHVLSRGVEINHFLKPINSVESAVIKHNKLKKSLPCNALTAGIELIL